MRTRLPLAAAALFVCGCGTVSTFAHAPGSGPERRPFGGVREDAEFLTNSTPGSPPEYGLAAVLALADLPLSLVADVVTLPWTVRAARLRNARPAQAGGAPANIGQWNHAWYVPPASFAPR